MNREKRRAIAKQLKNKGVNLHDVKGALLQATSKYTGKFKAGDKVKLQPFMINSNKNQLKKEWCKANLDKVLTVQWDECYGENSCIVTLEECTDVKWAFHESELIALEDTYK